MVFASLCTLIALSLAVRASPAPPSDLALFRRDTASGNVSLQATASVQGPGVQGTVKFVADENEVVTVTLNITGLSDLTGDGLNSTSLFAYHIHTNPIPSDGDCKGALGHLDPLHLTDALLCDKSQPQYCQEGDLSGKHGKLNYTEINEDTYEDPYLRFWPQPLSILGRSVVIHLFNSTRIACGNITSLLDGTADDNGPTNKSSTYVTSYPQQASPAPSTSIHLFISNTIDTALAAEATVPAALPDVEDVPNAILTTTTLTSSAGGALVTSGFPAVVAAPSSFSFSAGSNGASAFPTESQSFPSASSTASGSGASASATKTSSGASLCEASLALAVLSFNIMLVGHWV